MLVYETTRIDLKMILSFSQQFAEGGCDEFGSNGLFSSHGLFAAKYSAPEISVQKIAFLTWGSFSWRHGTQIFYQYSIDK